MENEDFLWAGAAFMGGIGGFQQAPCGSVTAATAYLGLRHRTTPTDMEKSKKSRRTIRSNAKELVSTFTREFAGLACHDLIGLDFSKPEEYKTFLESGIIQEKCEKYMGFVLKKLYEFEEKANN